MLQPLTSPFISVANSGYAATSCNNSCFGKRRCGGGGGGGGGVSRFRCTGDESTLLECGNITSTCNKNAGLLCCKSQSSDVSCSKPAMHLSTADNSTHLQPESNNSQGLVGVLGGLCIILTTLLVGVVMGWVCTRSRTPQPQERWVKTHNKVSQFLLHCFSSHRDHTGHPPNLTRSHWTSTQPH